MKPFVRVILIVATVLGLAACKNGQTIGGYDGDSPGAERNDWCNQSPPSGYCTMPDNN